MYRKYLKRFLDIILSLCALIVLSPFFLVFIVLGAIAMGGNPFFVQARIGKDEKVFYLIKFRSMSNEKDKNQNLIPNMQRLNKYGRVLRSTSIDEFPELLNILKGDMSIVGPRPLLTEYLPYYTVEEHHRHDIRAGLTGLAQVNGRNAITSWEERFQYDLEYVNNCSLKEDVRIILLTILKVFKRSDILVDANAQVGRLDDVRKRQMVHL